MKYAKAIPVPISSPETYSAISAGIVDGWEAPFDAIYSTKTYEVAPIISVTNHVYNAYLLATNAKFWDGLPTDIRTELKQVLDEVAAWQWSYADQLQVESRKKLAAARHVKVHDLDPAEKARMVQYFRGMHAQFRDVVGADVLEAMYKIPDPNRGAGAVYADRSRGRRRLLHVHRGQMDLQGTILARLRHGHAGIAADLGDAAVHRHQCDPVRLPAHRSADPDRGRRLDR